MTIVRIHGYIFLVGLFIELLPLSVCGSAQPTVAVAFEGGGFRSVATDAGLVAGLLAAYGKLNDVTNPTLAGTGLLDQFQIISSVSGGSWFAAELIYSDGFRDLIEGMAASPSTASTQFGANWTSKWLDATSVSDKKFARLMTVADGLLGSGIAESLQFLMYFLAIGFSWEDYVDVLLNSTAGLSPNLTLGSPVCDWARDKVWLVDNCVLSPSGSTSATIFQGKLFSIPKASYTADNTSVLPLYLPSQFSIRLGAGKNSSAPMKYITNYSAELLTALKYRGDVIPGLDSFTATSGPLDFGRSFEQPAGMLPVSKVVAASSAALGTISVGSSALQEVFALFSGAPTPWASLTPGGQAFTQANRLVQLLSESGGINQKSISASASASLFGVIDAGNADGTGISQAIAAGATEVLAVLNSNATNRALYVERLFPGGSQPDPQAAVLFPVFGSPSGASVEGAFDQFHQLALPASCEFLKVLAVGRVFGTTMDNKYFGIEAGRRITLNIVNIGTSLSIGEFQSFANYDAVVQELIDTLTSSENIPFVRDSLLPMLLGRKVARSGADMTALHI